jgi:hypothetical protein
MELARTWPTRLSPAAIAEPRFSSLRASRISTLRRASRTNLLAARSAARTVRLRVAMATADRAWVASGRCSRQPARGAESRPRCHSSPRRESLSTAPIASRSSEVAHRVVADTGLAARARAPYERCSPHPRRPALKRNAPADRDRSPSRAATPRRDTRRGVVIPSRRPMR